MTKAEAIQLFNECRDADGVMCCHEDTARTILRPFGQRLPTGWGYAEILLPRQPGQPKRTLECITDWRKPRGHYVFTLIECAR